MLKNMEINYMKLKPRLLKFILGVLFITMLVSCGGAEERKNKYLEKGKTYLLEKNYEKARVEIKNVLQIDPKYAEAYFYMGLLEEKNKELGKALANYRKAIELDKAHTRSKVKLAKIYTIASTKEFIEEAKKLLNEIKVEDPLNLEAKLISATIEYKTGDKKKAVVDLEVIVKEDSNYVDVISLLSSLYIVEGMELKAEKLLTKGVGDNRDNIPLRIALAKLHAKNKKYNLAEKYLKEALEIDPDKFPLHVALGMFYVASNQLEKAENTLRQAVKNDEEDVQRYLLLVEFLSSKISLKKAINELNQAIQKKPKLYDLQFAMVQIHEKTGKPNEAKTILKKIIAEKSFDPEGVKARNKMAVILLAEGDITNAEKYIKQVLEEYPNNSNALLASSRISLISFDAVSAINSLRTVVKNEPGNPEATLLLARSHEINNESSLAENELKKAIEANPANYKMHVNYAAYLGQKNRREDALDVVEKALVYFKDNYELLNLKLKLVATNNDETQIISVLNAMRRVAPQKYEVYLKKGQYYIAKRQYNEALLEFDQALDKTSNKYEVLKNIVNVYLMQKKSDQAIKRLKSRLNKHKSDAISQLLLGQIYLFKQDNDTARKFFKKAINNASKWAIPYTNLAASYLIEKNTSAALEVYKQAADVVSDRSSMLLKIASLYEQDKKYKKAMDLYNEILVVNENNKLAANNLASLLLDHGLENDIQKALGLVKNFDKINQPALKDTLGWAYAKSGNNKKAIEIFSLVVEKSPKVAIFQYHLGKALFDNGEKDKAKPYLQMAAESERGFSGKDDAKKLLNMY